VTGPLSDYQIEQVYGNAGYGGYGGGGTAYMLFYRRVEPDVNIVDVNASHVPRAGLTHRHSWHPPRRIQLEHAADTVWGVAVLDEINSREAAAAEAAEAKAAEVERQRDAVPFCVCLANQLRVVWIKGKKPWEEAVAQVCSEMGVEAARENVRLLRLDPLQTLPRYRDMHGSVPQLLPQRGDTPMSEMGLEGKVLQVEIKPVGAPWKEAPPVAGDGVAHIHFSDVGGGLDMKNHLPVPKGTSFADVRARIGEYLRIPDDQEVTCVSPTDNLALSGLALDVISGESPRCALRWPGAHCISSHRVNPSLSVQVRHLHNPVCHRRGFSGRRAGDDGCYPGRVQVHSAEEQLSGRRPQHWDPRCASPLVAPSRRTTS
jgi:hypothetical protein